MEAFIIRHGSVNPMPEFTYMLSSGQPGILGTDYQIYSEGTRWSIEFYVTGTLYISKFGVINQLQIWTLGGGGAGAQRNSQSDSHPNYVSTNGSGGGGYYNITSFTKSECKLMQKTNILVTIGAGGVGKSEDGGNGGASSFGEYTFAEGGGGGKFKGYTGDWYDPQWGDHYYYYGGGDNGAGGIEVGKFGIEGSGFSGSQTRGSFLEGPPNTGKGGSADDGDSNNHLGAYGKNGGSGLIIIRNYEV